MFGLSFTEVVIILLVGFILLGPDKLPTFAKGLARGIKEVKKFSKNLTSSIKEEISEVSQTDAAKSVVSDLKQAVDVAKDLKSDVKSQINDIVPEELQNAAGKVNSLRGATPKKLLKDKAIETIGLKDELDGLKDIKSSLKK